MKKQKVLKYQNSVLKALSGRIDDFYLAGGTALSLFYFQHRLSVDLDFFAATFSQKRVNEILGCLKKSLNREIKLVAQALGKDKAKLQIYDIYFSKKDTLKIDFGKESLSVALFVEPSDWFTGLIGVGSTFTKSDTSLNAAKH